jgi:hypothetical protein
VTDPKEAAERLLAYVDSRGDEQPNVDVYGAAAREQEEERRRQAERVQVRAVEQVLRLCLVKSNRTLDSYL